jgi:CD2 antigen cytoplasmic tail-binding protein 2
MPSVKFARSVDEQERQSQKRRRDEGITNEDHEDAPKKQMKIHPSEDELDDIDEWKDDEDPDEDLDVPSEKELLEAKRKRRQNRAGLDDDGKTNIDDRTSLAAEGIPIEPFHMKNEESDGTGFFDGDTYVFRKYNVEEGEEDEPDAWLDRLRDDAAEGRKTEYKVPEGKPKKEEPRQSMDDLSKEQLYYTLVPLMNDDETVSQALIRYGRLIKNGKGPKEGALAPALTSSQSTAKACLNDLTGAANALLLRGEVMIYQLTKLEIQSHLPNSQFHSERSKKRLVERRPPAEWEYRGNQDGALHGPYTTEQMIAWTKAGYFVGAQRVQIRTISEEPKQLSTQDELLNDLMNDDDKDDVAKEETEIVKGDWQWSNEVDFDAYLPIAAG